MLERDPPMPPRSDKPQADGAEYKATARSRNGSPQFMHGHIYLKRGWEVGIVVHLPSTACMLPAPTCWRSFQHKDSVWR